MSGDDGTAEVVVRPAGGLSAETRAVIAVVLEALDIPHAATVGHDETRDKIVRERLIPTVSTLHALVDSNLSYPGRLEASLEWLVEELAKIPPVGYVTVELAKRARECGASYGQAVASVEEVEAFIGAAEERAAMLTDSDVSEPGKFAGCDDCPHPATCAPAERCALGREVGRC